MRTELHIAWVPALLGLLAAVLLLACCERQTPVDTRGVPEITVTSPVPTKAIDAVHLSAEQQACVKAGNKLAFNFLYQLHKNHGGNLICSPLSLQYALGMTANGASGETLAEMLSALGYGVDGLDALNAYCHLLLDELPAVDLDVTLKLTDAMLVNDQYPVLPSFKQTIERQYYAAVENMPFTRPEAVAERVNTWAGNSTNGFINKLLEPADITPDMVALLMNALYFKAQWAKNGGEPLFNPDATYDEDFFMGGCDVLKVPMMHTVGYFPFAQMDGYQVLALPYAGGKFFFYILLPNHFVAGDLPEDYVAPADYFDFDMLVKRLPTLDWSAISASLKSDMGIRLSLPRFDAECFFDLEKELRALGINLPFGGGAQFDRMFASEGDFHIGRVIQKARISLAEWGTEAAAVTVVTMEKNAGPGVDKWVDFLCNHPFVYAIGERASGSLLFTGVYEGFQSE